MMVWGRLVETLGSSIAHVVRHHFPIAVASIQFQVRSVGFVVDNVALGQINSENF
jgi:hypothetical protein